MRPSITLLFFPILLTSLFAHADGYAAEAPSATTTPVVTFASLPPPLSTTQISTLASPPPPPLEPEVTFASPPAPAATMASSPPPPVASPPSAWVPAVKKATTTSPPPAWTPVRDSNDKAIRQVGQFAVRIYALSMHLNVVFVRVVSGQTQPWDGGYKYQLLISVRGTDAEAAQYDALVWGIYGTESSPESWKLLSFTPVK